VYLFKDALGKILYVGKSSSLRSRVKSYFLESRWMDAKTGSLVREIADLDYIVVDNEREAPIASAWRQLEQAGGHPDAQQHRQRAELAQQRSDCLAQLRAIGEPLPADEQDRRLVAGWNEDLLADCPEAVVLRVRYEKARDRLRAWATP
jgi:hypothetical protein